MHNRLAAFAVKRWRSAVAVSNYQIYLRRNLMKQVVVATVITFIAAVSGAYAGDSPKSDEQKTLYAVGASLAKSLAVFSFSESEFNEVLKGLTETVAGKKADFDTSAYNGKIQELAKVRRKIQGERQAAAGREFLDKAAKEVGAVKTDSGIVYIPVTEGKGDSPLANDIVKVNYRGNLPDGKEFDSSYKRGRPLEFKLSDVIKCWTEGVQKMKVGGKARLVCPANLAYGDNGAGEMILPGATLAFEIELLEVKKTPAIPGKPAAQ
jgi:FKBP-type peptidyl-prolyl cis-trans isomerase FkpA